MVFMPVKRFPPLSGSRLVELLLEDLLTLAELLSQVLHVLFMLLTLGGVSGLKARTLSSVFGFKVLTLSSVSCIKERTGLRGHSLFKTLLHLVTLEEGIRMSTANCRRSPRLDQLVDRFVQGWVVLEKRLAVLACHP